jgi:PAS domain S-box-containing protein
MRMAYQLQLQQKEREFEVAFTQAPIGKIFVDQKGYCTRVNRRICEMLGYDANTLEKKRLADLSPAREYEEDLRLIAQLMQKQEKFNEREKEMLTASGQAIWVKQSMAFVSHEDGTPQQLIIQLKDITREKESRRKLEESNVELEQFAYMASHDLKEPIRMIDGFMKLLEKNYGDRLDDTARKYVHFAADGAKRMNQLVDDLLLYSRATRQSGEPEDVELQEIMEEISKNYQPQLDKGSVDLHWHDLPQVRLPKAAIRTVLINLVSNAIKYQAPGGKPHVMVKADQVPGFWRISVVDNGIGIKTEFFDKIFIIFKRLHGKGEYEGSGIGLATCKRLVEKWGGRIAVSSVEGEGSSFSFTIPMETGGSG